MAIDFGPIPLPDSPMYEYYERRFSGSTAHSIASSPLSASPISEKAIHSRLLELAEKQRANEGRYTDDADEMSLLESQSPLTAATPAPPEYQVPLRKKLTFLGLYFFLNIALTLSNKELLLEVAAPWMLTVSHATVTSIGCWLLVATGRLKLTKLGGKEHLILLAFSSLFTINIAASNVSL